MAENEALVYTTLVAIGAVGAVILVNKIREKMLDAQIAAYNIDILKQKKEGLSKGKIALAQENALTAAGKLRKAIEHKISVEKEYQAKLAQAESTGESVDDIKLQYAVDLAKAEKDISDAQQEYNVAQGESLSLQQQSFEITKDLKSNLSSIPGILGLITSGYRALSKLKKKDIGITKQLTTATAKGAVAESAKGAASQGL